MTRGSGVAKIRSQTRLTWCTARAHAESVASPRGDRAPAGLGCISVSGRSRRQLEASFQSPEMNHLEERNLACNGRRSTKAAASGTDQPVRRGTTVFPPDSGRRADAGRWLRSRTPAPGRARQAGHQSRSWTACCSETSRQPTWLPQTPRSLYVAPADTAIAPGPIAGLRPPGGGFALPCHAGWARRAAYDSVTGPARARRTPEHRYGR